MTEQPSFMERRVSAFMSKSLSVRAAARAIVFATLGVVLVSGFAMRIFDATSTRTSGSRSGGRSRP